MPTPLRFRNEKGRLPRTAPLKTRCAHPYAAILSFDFLAARRRAIRPAAAAPKSITIGGAGTSVPPVEPPGWPDPPLEVDEEVEEDVEELVELDVDDEVLDEVDVLPPKLDDDVDVEVLTPPVEVDTPPVDVDTPPVDVETPPDVLEVLEPPVDVLEPPVDVLVEPPVLVLLLLIMMLMPPLLVDVPGSPLLEGGGAGGGLGGGAGGGPGGGVGGGPPSLLVPPLVVELIE